MQHRADRKEAYDTKIPAYRCNPGRHFCVRPFRGINGNLQPIKCPQADHELFNITAFKTQTNSGAYSYIETSDPSIPTGYHVGAWSYNRVASTSGGRGFIELGWFKETGQSNDPMAYWVAYDGTTRTDGRIASNLSSGTSYNYQVKQDTGDNWDIYFNELNSVDTTVDINNSSLGTAWVGAEVPNVNQDIGDSEDTGTTYRSTSDGNFYQLCSMSENNDSTANYSIEDITGCGTWRFYDD